MAVKLVALPSRGRAQQGDVSYEFEQGRVVFGRSAGADVRLPDLSVSEVHATLEQQGGGCSLRDEGSTNGTFVNGTALAHGRPRTLRSGDTIEIGSFIFEFTEGPGRGQITHPERTASLARSMLRDLLGSEHQASAPPYLRVEEGPDQGSARNLPEPPARLVVGRGEDADLLLSDQDVSRQHIEISVDADGASVRDMESKNGLEVNGRVLRERRLRHGDRLRIGATLLVFHDPAEEALAGMMGKADVTRTRKSAAPEPLPEPAATEAVEPAPSLLPAPRTSAGADIVVYMLAVLTLAASLLGLVWLFGS